MNTPQSIFNVATQYAFAGYASLFPLVAAALFWKGSTKWGALASTLWTAVAVLAVAEVQQAIPAPPPGQMVAVLSMGGVDVVTRAVQGTLVLGMLPVVPMTLISAALMLVVSKMTASALPRAATMDRFFPQG